jgi:hypothetical protein
MELVALCAITDTVGEIRAGQRFHVLDVDLATTMISRKLAVKFDPQAAWQGLDWSGATVVIMASGESLSGEQCAAIAEWRGDQDARSRRVIAINTTFQRAPFADAIYGADEAWWKVYLRDVRAACAGAELFSAQRTDGVREVKHARGPGLNKTKGVVNEGGNSGYQAINLAYHAGAKRLVLVGYDMRGGHWHGDHPPGLNKRPSYAHWIRDMKQLALDLEREGVQVANASPKSALRCFPAMGLDAALAL